MWVLMVKKNSKFSLPIKCSYSQDMLKMMLVSFCKNLGSRVAIEINLWINLSNASFKMCILLFSACCSKNAINFTVSYLWEDVCSVKFWSSEKAYNLRYNSIMFWTKLQ
jgi:hypothetical protein